MVERQKSEWRIGHAGLSQILTAVNNPPPEGVAPGMAVTDQWRDVASPGGVTNWLFPTAGVSSSSKGGTPPRPAQKLKATPNYPDNIAAHNAGFNAVSPYREGVERPHVDNKPGRTNHVWRRVHKIQGRGHR